MPSKTRIIQDHHASAVLDANGKPIKTIVTLKSKKLDRHIIIRNCSNVVIRGAVVHNWQAPGDVTTGKPYAIEVREGCHNITIESPEIHGTPDDDSQASWRNTAANGLIVRENNSNVHIVEPKITRVHYGMDLRGDGGSVTGGSIMHISADHICGRGNGWLIDGITLKKSYGIVKYKELHRDLIQLYSTGRGIIENWTVQNCTLGSAEITHRFEKPAQIFLFSDGIGKNIRVLNNKIITEHDLAIVMSVCLGAEIRGNRIWTIGQCKPQVRVYDERYGVKSERVIIDNNPIKAVGELTGECLGLEQFSADELDAAEYLTQQHETITHKPPKEILTEQYGEDVIQIKTDTQPPKEMSDIGIEVLEKSEGSRAHQYFCTANCPTIGVGHAMSQSDVASGKIELSTGRILEYRGKGLSQSEITALLQDDLKRFNQAVASLVKVDLAQHQFDSLVHFSFNVGVGAFKRSTLLKKLNQGKYSQVPFQIRRWVKQKELTSRREVECDMWDGYYNLKADPSKGFANKPVVEKLKQAAGSRGVKGTVIATTGLGGLTATILEIGSNKLNEVLKDPVRATETIKQGTKQITETASEVADSVGFIAELFGITPATYPEFLFWCLMGSLSVIGVGVLWFGYSRLNDMWTGVNP